MKKFLKQYTAAVKIVGKNPTIPILSGVLVDADKGEITFTDLDNFITISQAPIAGKGKHIFNARILGGILSKARGRIYSLSVIGEKLVVVGEERYALRPIGPHEDFPDASWNNGDDITRLSLRATDFKIPSYAISNEQIRSYLCGIYVHQEKGSVKTVATDGHRLCMRDTGAKVDKEFQGFIIQQKTIKVIQSLLSDISIEQKELKAKFTSDNIVIVSKLIDGAFPDYERVIPRYNISEEGATITCCDWKKIGRLCANNYSACRAIKMTARADGLLCEIDGDGEYQAEILVPYQISGHLVAPIFFNAKYFRDTAAAVDGDQCVAHMVNSHTPILFENGSNTHVIMPMRL